MSDGAPEQFGPYVVFEQLGKGGMATVHRAETRGIAGFRKPVALKRLLPSVASNPDFVQAFVGEARLASQLRHTNVAQTYDLGKVDGVYFIAMEFVSGPTLFQIVRQCRAAAGPMPLPIALDILIQVCDALDYAHNLCDERGVTLGIIHRDVSPSNVIVSNTGVAKLIDFGIAKATSNEVHTRTGIIKGKFGYLAPEYLAGHIDWRADLFGLGVIAHELLTTRPLFQVQDDFETLRRIVELPVEAPSRHNEQVTPDLDDIVLTALQREPDRRWQSAAAMRTALTNVARQLGEVVVGQHVVAWLQWAFSQKPGRPETTSGLSELIHDLDQPSMLIEVDRLGADGHTVDVLAETVRAPESTGTAPAVPGRRMPAAVPAPTTDVPTGTVTTIAPSKLRPVVRPRRVWPLLVLLLMLLAAAAVAAGYYGLVDLDLDL